MNSVPDESLTLSKWVQRAIGGKEQRDAATYLVGAVFQRLGLLLLLPILLRRLSVAEYGAFGLAQSATTLLPAVLTLNIPATVTRLYFDGANEAARGATAAKLTLLCLLVGGTTVALAATAAAWSREGIAKALGVPAPQALLIARLILIGALGSAMLQMGYGIWRAEHRAVPAAGVNILGSVLFLVLGAALALDGHLNLVTTIGAYAAATVVVGFTASGLACPWKYVTSGPATGTLAREAFKYGLPVLPYLLSMWVLAAGGRWIGRATLGLEGVAQFTLASQLATMIDLVGRSAYEAWAPRGFAFFAAGRQDEGRSYLREKGRQTLVLTACAAVVTQLLLIALVGRFAPAYGPVVYLFPVMACGALLDVAYLRPHNILLGLKRTGLIGRYTTAGVVSFVVLATVMSHRLGLWGLALAYVMAYAVQWSLATRAVRLARYTDHSALDESSPEPPSVLG